MIQNEQEYLETKSKWMGAVEQQLRINVFNRRCESACQWWKTDKEDFEVFKLEKEMAEYDANLGRKGKWIPTYTGKRFWYQDPRPEDVSILDIAHSLSLQNRYIGHTGKGFTVAQHCVIGSRHIDQRYALPFLLHDSDESYLGDIISPIKALFKEQYESLAKPIYLAVSKKFHCPIMLTQKCIEAVHAMDMAMAATENRDLVPTQISYAPQTELPLPQGSLGKCWKAEKAELRFLQRFIELTHGG